MSQQAAARRWPSALVAQDDFRFGGACRRLCLLSFVFLVRARALPGTEQAAKLQITDAGDQKVIKARELMGKAREHAQLTSWEGAIRCYEQVLKDFPDYHEARFAMAACYEGKNERGKAVEQYRLIAKAGNAPSKLAEDAIARLETLLVPALNAEREEGYDLAFELLHTAERLQKEANEDPKKALAFLQPLLDSIARFRQIQAEVPEYVPLYHELGLAYELAGQNEKAVEAYEEYLRRYVDLGIPLGQKQRQIRIQKAVLQSGSAARLWEQVAALVLKLSGTGETDLPNVLNLGLILGPELSPGHQAVLKDFERAVLNHGARVVAVSSANERLRKLLSPSEPRVWVYADHREICADRAVNAVIFMGLPTELPNTLDAVVDDLFKAGKDAFFVVLDGERPTWVRSLTPENALADIRDLKRVAWASWKNDHNFGGFFEAVRTRRAGTRESLAAQCLDWRHRREAGDQHAQLTSQQATQLTNIAIRSQELGGLHEAIEMYRIVLANYPDDYNSRFRLAQCYRAQGNFPKAIEQFRQVIKTENVPENVIELTCDEIEELSSPRLSPAQKDLLAKATDYLEAGMKLREQFYVADLPDNTPAKKWAFEGPNSPLNKAKGLLDQLQAEIHNYMPLYLKLGMVLEYSTDTGARGRPQAAQAYSTYLKWYTSLELPLTAKQRDARRRLFAVE